MPPKVDIGKCEGCGNCVAVCPTGVFEMGEGKSKVVHPEACTNCMQCVENCPQQAIELV